MQPVVSSSSQRRRKFLLILPVLVLPFFILLFFILGGGKKADTLPPGTHSAGLNPRLPDAHFKKGSDLSKLSLYEEAIKDSLRLRERMKSDPHFAFEFHGEKPDSVSPVPIDQNESKIMDRLAKLRSIINQKVVPGDSIQPPALLRPTIISPDAPPGFHNRPVEDPRLDQINSLLNKVMAIQYPETMSDSIRKLSLKNRRRVFYVEANQNEHNVSVLGTPAQGSFYNLDEDSSVDIDFKQNAIEAVVDETQTLVPGDPIQIRLLQAVFINGIKIPKNQLVTGTTSLSNERLKIMVSSITCEHHILPVSLEVHDSHGLPGIYIPGSGGLEAGKQSADQAISALSLPSLDPSIGAQAASAGIQAAKTLMGKRIKVVRLTVKAGYPILLKDNNQN